MQATFSAPVAVRGAPGIDLQVGERVVVARYVSGSGTDRLRFEYVIMLGDYDENGIGLSLERDSDESVPARRGGHRRRRGRRGDRRQSGADDADRRGRKPQGRGAPAAGDGGVDGVLAGERRHLRDRRDHHGGADDAHGRDGAAARAAECLA